MAVDSTFGVLLEEPLDLSTGRVISAPDPGSNANGFEEAQAFGGVLSATFEAAIGVGTRGQRTLLASALRVDCRSLLAHCL